MDFQVAIQVIWMFPFAEMMGHLKKKPAVSAIFHPNWISRPQTFPLVPQNDFGNNKNPTNFFHLHCVKTFLDWDTPNLKII